MADLSGRQLDEYRLEKLIGEGGMARVYLGEDVRLKRRAAIKVIATPFHGNPEYQMRFEREGQAVARLEHPNIVRLYRFGEASGLVYMAMQYIEGSDLASTLARYRRARKLIPPLDAARVVREVGAALDYAHQAGVIHRDVKPSNILLDAQGRAYLTDFGLARLADVGTQGRVFGSPRYMAPEQAISSAEVSPLSDLYSLGVIVYEMYAGRVPFDGLNPADIALAHMSELPRPPRKWRPSLSEELEAVLLRALEKDPARRYPSGAALADSLEEAVQRTYVRPPSRGAAAARLPAGAVELPPLPAAVVTPENAVPTLLRSADEAEPLPAPARRFPRRRRWMVAALALLAVVVVSVILVARPNDQPDEQQPASLPGDADGDGLPDPGDRCPEQAGSQAARGCPFLGWVTASRNANLRSGPGTQYRIVGVVKPGDPVVLLGRSEPGDWLHVRTLAADPAAETTAWIAEDLVTTDTPLADLPYAPADAE